MAVSLNMYGNIANAQECSFFVDSEEEIKLLPTSTTSATGKFKDDANMNVVPAIGSTCIVGNGTSDIAVYILTGDVGWKKI